MYRQTRPCGSRRVCVSVVALHFVSVCALCVSAAVDFLASMSVCLFYVVGIKFRRAFAVFVCFHAIFAVHGSSRAHCSCGGVSMWSVWQREHLKGWSLFCASCRCSGAVWSAQVAISAVLGFGCTRLYIGSLRARCPSSKWQPRYMYVYTCMYI